MFPGWGHERVRGPFVEMGTQARGGALPRGLLGPAAEAFALSPLPGRGGAGGRQARLRSWFLPWLPRAEGVPLREVQGVAPAAGVGGMAFIHPPDSPSPHPPSPSRSSMHLSTPVPSHASSVHPPTHLSTHSPRNLATHPSTHSSVQPPTHPSPIHPRTQPPTHHPSPVRPPVCPSTH